MIGILLALVAVCDSEDSFLTQSLFSSITQGCQQFYQGKGVTVGADHYPVFVARLQQIEAQNNNVESTYISAANCFTALSDHEISRWLGAVPPSENEVTGYDQDEEDTPMVGGSEIPEQYDRRKDNTSTKAKSQGSCGSCWSFSAVAVLESAYLKLTGAKPSDVDFSEQQLLDCTYESEWGQDGCEGGWMVAAWWNLMTTHNSYLVSEASKRYTVQDTTCSIAGLRNAFSKVKITKVWKSNDHSAVTKPMGVRTAKAIYKVSVIAVAWRMEDAFISYSSGIFNTPCEDTTVDHALTLVGYTSAYFIAKNSWGEHWGEEGHIRLSRNAGNLCSFLSYVMYPEVKCKHDLDNNGMCAESTEPTEAPGPECTKKCQRGKVCYIRQADSARQADRMGCKCPTGYYGFNCQEQIKCGRKDRWACAKKKARWSDNKWSFKCQKKLGMRHCPHSCGHCDQE